MVRAGTEGEAQNLVLRSDSERTAGSSFRRCASGGRCANGGLYATWLIGGVSGCVGKTVTAPLSRVTVLAQTATLFPPSATTPGSQQAFANGRILEGARQIVQQEGVLTLWRGNLCTCVHRFPFTGINFAVVLWVKKAFPWLAHGPAWGAFVPGAAAGCAAVISCYPLEVVRTRLMTHTGSREQSGWWVGLQRLARMEGATGMYRGISLSLTMAVPQISISFGVYDTLKKWLEGKGVPNSSFIGTFGAGGISGAVGSMVTFPLDVLKRRVQVMGMDASVPKRSCRHEAAHLWRCEGPRGFVRGLVPEVVKVFPTLATTFVVFEQLRRLEGSIRG